MYDTVQSDLWKFACVGRDCTSAHVFPLLSIGWYRRYRCSITIHSMEHTSFWSILIGCRVGFSWGTVLREAPVYWHSLRPKEHYYFAGSFRCFRGHQWASETVAWGGSFSCFHGAHSWLIRSRVRNLQDICIPTRWLKIVVRIHWSAVLENIHACLELKVFTWQW